MYPSIYLYKFNFQILCNRKKDVKKRKSTSNITSPNAMTTKHEFNSLSKIQKIAIINKKQTKNQEVIHDNLTSPKQIKMIQNTINKTPKADERPIQVDSNSKDSILYKNKTHNSNILTDFNHINSKLNSSTTIIPLNSTNSKLDRINGIKQSDNITISSNALGNNSISSDPEKINIPEKRKRNVIVSYKAFNDDGNVDGSVNSGTSSKKKKS